ncbi:hypothetical protein [Neisseria lactamica]|uniref:hypothetical protein n=1 Tax=Neisseria lactamica TaxID=486 RepID=UPI000308E93F|nr:hypothetical protein [Neisseria lactamica]
MPSENGRRIIGKTYRAPSRLLNYTSRHPPSENGFHIPRNARLQGTTKQYAVLNDFSAAHRFKPGFLSHKCFANNRNWVMLKRIIYNFI